MTFATRIAGLLPVVLLLSSAPSFGQVRSRLLADDQPLASISYSPESGPLVVSADGKRSAYIAISNDEKYKFTALSAKPRCVVVDGEPGEIL